MNEPWRRALNIVTKIPLLVVILLACVAGYLVGNGTSSEAPAKIDHAHDATEGETVWTCSMHPQIRLPQPGACPICGMDLIPAASTGEAAKPAKKVKYACSMFCVPPMDRPGKCPICGMEMLPVEEDAGDADTAAGPTLTLSPHAQKLAEIQTQPVRRAFPEAEVRMVGKVELDETRLGYITAWVPGRLDQLYVDYTGVPVRKGDHLVYLYSPQLATAQTELLQAIAASAQLENSSITSIRATVGEDIEAARDRLRLWGLTDEQIQEIETRGTPSDHMTIYAPMGGIVIHKSAVEGMYVDTGTRIYTIADLSHLWVKLDAYESDLAWIRYGQSVTFETEAYPGETFTGKIAFIDPVLDQTTRTVKVRVNVPNADGRLKPEMFVRAIVRANVAAGGKVMDPDMAGKWICPMHPEVVTDTPDVCRVCGMPLVPAESLGYVAVDGNGEAPLVIPASAALRTGRRAVVYVAVPDSPGQFQGREVILGSRAGDHYVVREGLSEGEVVVTNGNFKIDSAIQILAKPSMMNPKGGGPAPGHKHGSSLATTDQPAAATESKPAAAQPLRVPASFASQLDGLLDAYFAEHYALSRDDLPAANTAARNLDAALVSVDMTALDGSAPEAWMKRAADLKSSNTAVVSASDIESARRGFALVSETLLGVVRQFGGGSGRPLYQAHCPMAFNDRGANWLQDKKLIENPYFGSAMFRCGVIKETFTVGGEKD